MKKRYVVLSAMLMASTMLSGCSMPAFGSAPKSPSDVVDKYVELMEESVGYHTDMTMDFSIKAGTQGMNLDLPIVMELSADILDGNLHGDMNMYMSLMGQEMEQTAEVYVEAGKRGSDVYTYNSDDGCWTVSEDDSSTSIALGFSELDGSSFEDAEMEFDKKKGVYIVTQSFGDFADTSSAYESMADIYGSMAEMMPSMDADRLLDQWMDAKVVYTFDEDCYLLSVEIEDCEYSDVLESDGVKLDVSVVLAFSFEFSDYGKIDESDVEVPKKVKNEAIPSVEAGGNVNVDVNIGGDDEDPEDIKNPGDLEFPVESVEDPSHPADDAVYATPAPGEDVDPGFSALSVTVNDLMGAYKGVAFTASGDSWDKTFGADGWEFGSDDGEYNFLTAENSKYKDVTAYVYNSRMDSTTRADIAEKGIFGYSVDCSWAEGEYPPMTWGGLTFGASLDDIKAVYGQPEYSFSGEMYEMVEYNITNDIDIQFYIYHDGGLLEVDLSYYEL